MQLPTVTSKLIFYVSCLTPVIAAVGVNAQIIPASDGTGTTAQQSQNRINISGGQTSSDGGNLFHSFSQFNVNSNQTGNFISTPNIQNILGRINGGNPSLINGMLQVTGGNANLFLMNPSGIVFGANASLNLPASFSATTATGINFANGQFNAIGNNNYSNLFGNPTAFSFGLTQPGSIVNGGKLEVSAGQNINLIGGTILSTGTVNAPQGNVNIAAVPGTSLVRITQPGNLLSLEIPGVVTNNFTPATLPQLLTGSGIAGVTVTGNNVSHQGIPIQAGDVVVNKLNTGTATVAAQNNLNLIGSNLNTTGDLTLRAQNTATIKDTQTEPLKIVVDGRLLIQGDQKIDIFALNNPNTNLSAGGDLLLRSNFTVGGDAHFNTGGNFKIEQLDGKLGGLFSPYDPIIIANGDVSLASYDGASLHIIAGGSVSIPGDITIRGADGNGNSALDQGLTETLDLADGTPQFIVDGINNPTLDIRAGVSTTKLNQLTLTTPPIVLGNTPVTITANPTDSSIKIGNINFLVDFNLKLNINANSTFVLLTNQYSPNPNLSQGNITVTGNINTLFTEPVFASAGPATGKNIITSGDITIVGKNNIKLNQLTTGTENITDISGTAKTGNILVNAIGDIEVTGLISTANLRGQTGDVSLNSTNGKITTDKTTTQLRDSSFNNISSNFKAGNINIIAANEIDIKDLDTQSLSGTNPTSPANHTGGNITLESKNNSILTGNVATGVVSLGNSGNVKATAKTNLTTGNIITTANNGNGGNIELTSTGGQVTTQQLASKIGNSTNVIIKAGDINLTAAGAIGTKDIDTRSQNSQLVPSGSGNINLTSNNGSINTTTISTNTGNITLTANGDINATGLLSSEYLRGGTGNISLTSNGGKITTDRVSTQLGDSNFTTAKAGDINLKAAQAIVTKNIDSGSLSNDASHTGGNINIESTNSSIDTSNITTNIIFADNSGTVTAKAKTNLTTGNINTNTNSGNGGKVSLNSGNDITVGSIDTSSKSANQGSGNGGAVDITATNFFLAKNSINIPAVGTTPASLASIYTNGNTASGAITIRHGGNNITPFVVGNATTNGTKDAIVSSNTNAINPPQSFLPSFTQGDIQIITAAKPLPPQPPQPPEPPVEKPKPNCPPDCGDKPPIEQPPTTKQPPAKQVSITETIDPHFSDDFDLKPFNTEQPQVILQKIQNSTGIKPAIIYAVFNPANLDINIAKDKNNISELARNSFQLELVMVTATGTPIRRTVPITREQLLETVKQFRKQVTNPSDSTAFMPNAQQLYQWLIAPIENDLKARNIQNLVFVMEGGLRSLPVAALHDGKQFLVERYSVGMMPSIGLTDTRYVDIRNAQVLAMGAENTPGQQPLPAVPIELKTISSTIWTGKSVENEQFTARNLVSQRQQQPFGILHLATHGEFKAGGTKNSYIQFKDERLGIDRLRQLKLNDPPVELMVLSACRTALGDEDAELGFSGLAYKAGVKSAMGSIWYVSDEGTLGLMTSFYRNLRTAPIKAEALRQAQVAMLQGKVRLQGGKLVAGKDNIDLPPSLLKLGNVTLVHPFYWAAFTIVGNPW